MRIHLASSSRRCPERVAARDDESVLTFVARDDLRGEDRDSPRGEAVAKTEERKRHDLGAGCERVLGPEPAETLMGALVPVGADLATRQDLVAFEGRMHGRLAALDARTDGRFAALEERTDSRFAALDARTDSRFAALEERIDGRFAVMDERFNTIDERFNTMGERFNAMDERFDRLRYEMKADLASGLRTFALGLFFSLGSVVIAMSTLVVSVVN
jgi:hypothetical protein